jgi:hypothetical protein
LNVAFEVVMQWIVYCEPMDIALSTCMVVDVRGNVTSSYIVWVAFDDADKLSEVTFNKGIHTTVGRQLVRLPTLVSISRTLNLLIVCEPW